MTYETCEGISSDFAFDWLVTQTLPSHSFFMAEPVNMQDKNFRFICYSCLLKQILFFAFPAWIAFNTSLCFEFKDLVVSKARNIGVLFTLLFPGLSTRLAYKLPFQFNFK